MMAVVATAVMTLGEIFGPGAGDLAGIEIKDIVLDSRQVSPGAAFLALQGADHHGLKYAEDALARGAVAVVYEPPAGDCIAPAGGIPVPNLRQDLGAIARQFFALTADSLRLTGVTGTNGKSTVAYLVANAQSLGGAPCNYLGTLGCGVPPDLEAQSLTTPDCLTLHRSLREQATGFAAIEVSSHALAQDRIAGLDFHTAVFTNLSHDHLDYHGDIDSYRETKARLFAVPSLQHAVFFADDPVSEVLAQRLQTGVTPFYVSMLRDADLRGRLLRSDLLGLKLEVRAGGETAEINSPLVGDFNAENLLLALGALIAWDAPLDQACDLLSQCRTLDGRMQVFGGRDGKPWVVVDYAHTPAALERALSNLRQHTGASLWCVFGCGGERDQGKRAAMGRAAAQFADHIVLTDDNPRDEDPGRIVADIRGGVGGHADLWIEHDRRRAIADAIGQAGDNDIVLVAGKGHETAQWVAGGRRELNDRAVVEAVLEGRA
jgi:UDP-N-acetylmuramoyl-L-alanyl-D-glutamate--2,6-diaminopimelate ligase